jgi:hypothetical protein
MSKFRIEPHGRLQEWVADSPRIKKKNRKVVNAASDAKTQ